MSPEAQRIAIAEACGWQHRLATVENPVERGGMRLPNSFGPSIEAWWHYSRPENPGVYAEPPRYLSDLNAMHDAEKRLTNNQRRQWVQFLIQVHPLRYDPFSDVSENGDGYMKIFLLVNATAGQRAEAFLRTLGKWDESK